MASPLWRLAVALLVLGTVQAAHADEDEASLHVQGLGGLARLEEKGAAATVPMLGLAARFTWSTSDLFAYETIVTAAQTRTASYDDATVTVGGVIQRGAVTRATRLARAELGVHFRFGARYIPTLHAGLGAQVRQRGQGSFRGLAGALSAETSIDLTASLAGGLDYRLGRRWIAGFTAGAVHAFPLDGAPGFDALELNLHLAAYWYPLW